MSDKIPVGISACLLGGAVRFDGGHKRLEFAVEQLAPYVHFEPICPEMAIGLPTPRPALRLIKTPQQIVLRHSNDNTVDVTTQMQQFSEQRVAALQHLCGYIVCAKSPSCGMERVKVYSETGEGARKSGVGLFTAELLRQMPWLPVEEDGRLNDAVLRENFVERVYALYELNMLWRNGLTRGGLIAFHSRYKLSLLAHSQPEYRELGRFVAGIEHWDSLEAFVVAYRSRLMSLLKHKATRRNHTNVLMHVQGYFRRQLSSAQRQELAQLIDHYRQGMQPLLAPITLLKHYMAEYPDNYLAQQRYFEPYPEALRLRYGH
ncbi:membrane protein [Chania multitudinisentens RB-25]|uniref:Membrane protein n=1 Tax=Chania multitudinisentens RB-25 TaxID=1441930 RepID=W0LD02_9GAMM|nr:2-thiouracil desulfurase family protein [Chania multitudinisentens]AHG21606.1 membrane protein [Chania multitudinisentens RB-25]